MPHWAIRCVAMLTTDNYGCTWDLFKSIPSLVHLSRSVVEETAEFNRFHASHAMARLVDSRRAKESASIDEVSLHDR